MKNLIISLIALVTSIAQADTLGIHLFSVHDKPNFNDENPGIYYIHDSGLTVGHFKNSERNQSNYAGYTFNYENISISTVVITGYKIGTIPAIIPSYVYPINNNISLRTSLLYNPIKDGASALHWSLEYRYD